MTTVNTTPNNEWWASRTKRRRDAELTLLRVRIHGIAIGHTNLPIPPVTSFHQIPHWYASRLTPVTATIRNRLPPHHRLSFQR